jgi:NAD-dependent DNA ligase
VVMAKQVKTLPKMLKPFVICLKYYQSDQYEIPEFLEVRGEVLMPKSGLKNSMPIKKPKVKKLLLIHVMRQQEV